MQIDSLTEMMFSQAVALAQNGRMKSTIHCKGDEIFILNMDNTILLRYQSPQEFDEPFSFFSNDYESRRIRVEEGKVVFITNAGGLRRTKVCPAPKIAFADVKKIWEGFSPAKSESITLVKEMASLLEEGLSHIEVSKTAGGPVVLLQRDIYSGSRVEVERNKSNAGLLDIDDDDLAFGPVGIRTVDFAALFVFSDSLTWYVQKGKRWVYFEDNTGRLSGILSTCLYDELGDVGSVTDDDMPF